MLDIDDFKLVNDTHGHQVGGVLISLGNIIKTNLRAKRMLYSLGRGGIFDLTERCRCSYRLSNLDKLRRKIAERKHTERL